MQSKDRSWERNESCFNRIPSSLWSKVNSSSQGARLGPRCFAHHRVLNRSCSTQPWAEGVHPTELGRGAFNSATWRPEANSSWPCWPCQGLSPDPDSKDGERNVQLSWASGQSAIGLSSKDVHYCPPLDGDRIPAFNYLWASCRWERKKILGNCVMLVAWCEELTHWKRPWCWERLKAGEEGDDRGWDGWMASPTRWT